MGTEAEEEAAIRRESGLHQGLSKAQAVMIGLGGAIGVGLFLGSANAIGTAGPAVLVSYLIAGFVALVMVFSLSEMAVVHPAAGSFGVYAETYLNPWAGFVVRYLYWISQVLAVGAEAVAIGIYMQFWFPDTPIWLWSVGFAFALVWVNSREVKNFGTIEYWFAMIKVVAIVAFILLGLRSIIGVGTDPIGLHNLTGLPGGFMPKGPYGVWLAVIWGVLAFNGIEVIAVTSGEVKNPEKVIPAALRTMLVRLFLFYILAIGVIVAFVPWTDIGGKAIEGSPFVKVFSHTGIREAAGIMNFVVLTAALSSMNTNVYLCSRMLFSLSRGGFAPRFLGSLSKRGTPTAATILSGACILGAAAMSKLSPDAFNQLFGVAMFAAMGVWIIILLSHLSFRRRHGAAELPVKMPFFPLLQLAGLAILGALLVTMGLEKDWKISWTFGLPGLGVLTVAYFIAKLFRRRPA